MAIAAGVTVIVGGCVHRAPASSPGGAGAPAGVPRLAGDRQVALTADDLGATPASVDLELSRAILHNLAVQHAPVAVFANCKDLTDEALLLWKAAGATIGNHTASHLSIDAGGDGAAWGEAWWRDVETCHRRLSESLQADVRYFRFPYLRYGKRPERKEAATRLLATLHYRVGHVTAATSEWLLADYYQVAIDKHRADLAAEIANAYVDHMVETLREAVRMAQTKVGREVAQITLFHVNRLAADHLGDALAALKKEGWQFISLEQALADPVYRLADAYTGGCGCSWLARIEPPLTPRGEYAFGDYEDQLRARFEARISAVR